MMDKPALLGGPRAKRKGFPPWPYFDDQEREALNRVLESRNWWRTQGVEVSQFEKEFASYHRVAYGLAVTKLSETAKRRGLLLIEDSSHAHGSEWRGQKMGRCSPRHQICMRGPHHLG